MFVYAIQCHRLTNPLAFTVAQLLSDSRNLIIIHVDSKTSDDEILKIKHECKESERLVYVQDQDRIDVSWGSFSQVEATLVLMKYALRYDFKYFSLISGDDVPLKPVNVVIDTLDLYFEQQKEFIGVYDHLELKHLVEYRYPKCFYKKDSSLVLKVKRFLLFNLFKLIYGKKKIDLKLAKGCSWFTITKSLLGYIIDFLDNNPEYQKYFETGFLVDELFFSTIVYHSPYLNKVNGFNSLHDCEMAMRYIDWESGPDFPRTLGKSDFEKMKNSDMLFARKVSAEISYEDLLFFIE